MFKDCGHADLQPLPDDLKNRLKSEHHLAYWTDDPNGFFSCYERFSSRTPAWRSFLKSLYTSSLAKADFIAYIFEETPCGEILHDLWRLPVRSRKKPDAFDAIKGWPWCEKVEFESCRKIQVRMKNLRASLPFILSLYQDPPYESHEASTPPGWYNATLMIRFKDFQFSVYLIRNSYSGFDFDLDSHFGPFKRGHAEITPDFEDRKPQDNRPI